MTSAHVRIPRRALAMVAVVAIGASAGVAADTSHAAAPSSATTSAQQTSGAGSSTDLAGYWGGRRCFWRGGVRICRIRF